MGRIDQQTVQRILEAADIVEVVSDFVKLRRSGANYKGLCPFHNERTPSFSVNKARNICKCFSCGKGGSPVNFIMEHEQMSYQEALRYLARKYNIEIVEKEMTDDERRAQNEREAMLALNEFALSHFKHNLTDTVDGQAIAMPYFRHRGVSDAMIARFHLGYALDRPDDLIKAATEAGYNPQYLTATGLAGVSQRPDGTERLYDRYRGRVIFPIHSVSGRVVGFGARTMRTEKNVAKYVNSPESIIYHKNRELYGFFQAKSAIAKADKCIMVEGYLDVISMHQSGIENVVASSGTSLTEGQIRAVSRFTDNVTLIYDADPAGIKASLRGIRLLLAEKMNVRVLSLPPGDDPDSFAQSHSSEEVAEYLRTHETDIIAFMAKVLMKEVDTSDPMARAKVINVIIETVAYVDEPVKRQEYLSECSRLFGVAENVLLRQLNVFITRIREEQYKESRRQAARATLPAEALEEPAHGGTAEAAADSPEPDKENNPSGASPEESSEPAAPLLDLTDRHLLPYETVLMRFLVRYGLCDLGSITNADDTISSATVYDFIAAELSQDGYSFSDAVYSRIFDIIGQLRGGSWNADRETYRVKAEREVTAVINAERARLAAEGASMGALEREEKVLLLKGREDLWERMNAFDAGYARNILVNSPDDKVRAVASDLSSDRYSLSKLYIRTGAVETEERQLRILVPRAVNELRAALLSDIIADLNKKLAEVDPADVETITDLMQRIVFYKEKEKDFGKILGERIILPSK